MFRILIATVFAAALALAQQTTPATYETGRRVMLEGPVTRIEWTNPRAYIFVNASEGGEVTNWAVEIGNPLDLEKDGWKSDSVKIGDTVSVTGTPAKTPARALASSVMLSGKRIFTAAPHPAAAKAAAQPAPRWPNGHIRLGPAPGKKGYWSAPGTATLVESGVRVSIGQNGLLANLSDASRVAPMQAWAEGVFEYRQRTMLKDDPYSRCLPPGGPRQFQTANGFQFVEQPELGRILVLLGGGDRNWRVIYTDGRPVAQGDDLVQAYYGTSVGHWEKDTLVVESVGFNERFWMANNGLPHTEALHLTEKFTRSDLNTLSYQVTINDPRTYTRPWQSGWTNQWVADREPEEYFCEENAEQTFVR